MTENQWSELDECQQDELRRTLAYQTAEIGYHGGQIARHIAGRLNAGMLAIGRIRWGKP